MLPRTPLLILKTNESRVLDLLRLVRRACTEKLRGGAQNRWLARNTQRTHAHLASMVRTSVALWTA